MGIKYESLIYFLLLIQGSIAFIFDDECDKVEAISAANYKYTECLEDRVIARHVRKFKKVYNQIREMSDEEMKLVREKGFKTALPIICESKRSLASSVTDFVEPITRECVKDEKLQKQFSLNTLLMLQTQLEFFCGMEESIFRDIYQNQVLSCFKEKKNEIDVCRRKSFKLLFFDKAPEKLYWIQLVNGKVCNFDYTSMLNCALEHLDTCKGSTEVLAYFFDVLKRNSLCYKRKNVSEIIENVSGYDNDLDNIAYP